MPSPNPRKPTSTRSLSRQGAVSPFLPPGVSRSGSRLLPLGVLPGEGSARSPRGRSALPSGVVTTTDRGGGGAGRSPAGDARRAPAAGRLGGRRCRAARAAALPGPPARTRLRDGDETSGEVGGPAPQPGRRGGRADRGGPRRPRRQICCLIPAPAPARRPTHDAIGHGGRSRVPAQAPGRRRRLPPRGPRSPGPSLSPGLPPPPPPPLQLRRPTASAATSGASANWFPRPRSPETRFRPHQRPRLRTAALRPPPSPRRAPPLPAPRAAERRDPAARGAGLWGDLFTYTAN